MSERIEKINSLIKDNLSEIITRELNIKTGVFLTILKVDTSSDLKYTKVFVGVFPEKETNYVMKTLQKETYTLQGKLNKSLHIKIFPKIKFINDSSGVEVDKIEKILREIGEEK